TIVVAASPCVLAGLYHTGHQASAALARLGPEAPEGWRSGLLATLGVPRDPDLVFSCLLHGALYVLPALAVAWVAGGLCERLFAWARDRPRSDGLLATALLFTLLLAPATPLWQVALGMAFGTVFTKELFGGTGLGFVSAPAAGAAFLALAWPDTLVGDPVWTGLRGHTGTVLFSQVAGGGVDVLAKAGITWPDAFLGRIQGTLGTTSTLACALGAVVLFVRGVASWRVVGGILLGAFGTTLALDAGGLATGPMADLGWSWHVVLGAFAFGAVFLATDPSTAATTQTGRWIVGVIVGSMIVLIRIANPLHPDGVVFAVLFGNVFTPLVDSGVVWWHGRRRRRRHG
ncbi:MAG: RnfABCDGE type electron transport complex subunit D, partial [Planctomycetota bacterium]